MATKTLKSALLAALLLPFAAAARAAITRTWISTTSIGVSGVGQDVALSPAADAVYSAGVRNGNFYVGKFAVSDGSVLVEYSTGPGYALGVGVGPSGQVATIGGVLTNGATLYQIALLDPNQLQPVNAGWPVYTTGYYDLGAVSTTNYRASAVVDAGGNVFVGFNSSSFTATIRKYNSSGVQVGSDVTISSTPYIYFEQLAIDTTTSPNKIYAVLEEPSQVQFQAFNNDLTSFAGPVNKPWIGTDVGRRQSITVGPNQVIVGGQQYDPISNPGNPYHTWAQELTRTLTNQGQLSYQFFNATGGNSSFGLAQRQPNCGAYYSVGDSTGVWVGLYDSALNFTNVRYYDTATAVRGNAIVADSSREVYVTGTTKAGFLFVSRLDDSSCATAVPPPPQPCTVTPSAFPNPFKAGKDQVKIQYDLLPGVVNAATPPQITMEVYGPDGSLVRSFTNLPRARFNTFYWDGKNNQSAVVTPGNYDATLEITTNPPNGPVCRSLIRMGAR